MQFYLTSCQYTSNPLFIDNLSVNVFNDSDGFSNVNMSAEATDVYSRAKIALLVKTQSAGSQEYDNVILKADADTCKIQQGVFGNYLIKFITDKLKLHSNIKFECVLPKGPIYIRNLSLNQKIDMPLFVTQSRQGTERKWEVTVGVKLKAPKSKTLSNAMSLKFWGYTAF